MLNFASAHNACSAHNTFLLTTLNRKEKKTASRAKKAPKKTVFKAEDQSIPRLLELFPARPYRARDRFECLSTMFRDDGAPGCRQVFADYKSAKALMEGLNAGTDLFCVGRPGWLNGEAAACLNLKEMPGGARLEGDAPDPLQPRRQGCEVQNHRGRQGGEEVRDCLSAQQPSGGEAEWGAVRLRPPVQALLSILLTASCGKAAGETVANNNQTRLGTVGWW